MAVAIEAGARAPEFSLPATDGGLVRFARGADEHTLIIFFESNCSVCQAEIPRLAEVLRSHPAAPVRILGVAVGRDTPASAAHFQRQADFPFPTGVDVHGEVRRNYRLGQVPTAILIDPEGKVLRKYIGARGGIAMALEQAFDSLEKGIAVPEYSLEGDTCAL